MSQLAKAYALKDVSDTRTLYDEWAATYDTEMADQTQDYVGPTLAAVYTLKCLGPEKIENAKILDAGCGTGLVGVQLAKVGAKHIDGVDLSQGMLDIARKADVYEDLKPTDLTAPLVYENATYDAIVCIGTFTQGHVGPDAFSEFVRVTSKGGFIVATVLGTIWENGGYAAKVAGLAEEGKVKLLSSELEDYRRGAGVQARMIVLQVLQVTMKRHVERTTMLLYIFE